MRRVQAACPRYHAHVFQRKAYGLREQYERWWNYQYDWHSWLPSKWYRIGSCETGYGNDPNWHHHNSSFEGAFGFWYGTWDQYKPSGAPSRADWATPRQQYQAALNVYAEHGYGAWGCGGA